MAPGSSGNGDRRAQRHREEDIEQAEIVEHAVEDAPIVRRLLRTGKVAAAVGACCTLIGGATGALGYNLVGPREISAQAQAAIRIQVDTNSARIARGVARTDSLLDVVGKISAKVDGIAYIQCVQLRVDHPELRPDGCDGIAKRSRR